MAVHQAYTERAPNVHRRGASPAGARSRLLTYLAALGVALPAAAGTFQPPQGCQAYLTVQSRSCKVSHHYRCAADAPGDQWRIDFGINGAYFRSRIDYETQWVESHESDGTIDLLEPGARDPASFSELLASGYDSFDFTTQKSNGRREHVTGWDRLPGETVTIDGVTLERTKYDVAARDDGGGFLWSARGGEFIHREWRIFLSGTGLVDLGEGALPQDFSPVEFAQPGEPGFLSTIPLYDCEPTMAEGARREATPVPASLRIEEGE